MDSEHKMYVKIRHSKPLVILHHLYSLGIEAELIKSVATETYEINFSTIEEMNSFKLMGSLDRYPDDYKADDGLQYPLYHLEERV
jgi:hypothetical protein